jgi:hypothetical protein
MDSWRKNNKCWDVFLRKFAPGLRLTQLWIGWPG